MAILLPHPHIFSYAYISSLSRKKKNWHQCKFKVCYGRFSIIAYILCIKINNCTVKNIIFGPSRYTFHHFSARHTRSHRYDSIIYMYIDIHMYVVVLCTVRSGSVLSYKNRYRSYSIFFWIIMVRSGPDWSVPISLKCTANISTCLKNRFYWTMI